MGISENLLIMAVDVEMLFPETEQKSNSSTGQKIYDRLMALLLKIEG